MFLKKLEAQTGGGPYADLIRAAQSSGRPVPGIWHLFKLKPEATAALGAFTQSVMRGPSPLTPGFRELIAAYTSKLNRCPF
jgi:alkylhydroperoxidase family enzyme